MRVFWLAILLGLATSLSSCGPDDRPCPRDLPAPDLAAYVGESYPGNTYTRRDFEADPAHPHLSRATERRVEVLSDSSIAVTYTREDGAVVVETYEVTGMELRPRQSI